MAQSVWYLRHEDQIFGPFPVPQIEEAMKLGEVSPDWEISLNQSDWLSIADSAQFKAEKTAWTTAEAEDTVSWREQREQARLRWLQDTGSGIAQEARDPARDAAVRNSIAHDYIRTHALLKAEKSKPVSLSIGLLALVLIAGVGIFIWLGQGDKPIQTGISQTVDCAATLSNGVNWTGCNRRGISQPGGQARNARLDGAVIDDAHLKNADLSYASLKKASLRNAELTGIKLTGADLSGANLAGADLSNADLSYAVLTGANLTGVRLTGARLDKATWIDGHVCAPGSLDTCQ